MNERSAIFRSILAAPEDDVPRLVFADWLEEHGEAERAAFIRLQCELAGLHPWDSGYYLKRLRAERLLRSNAEAWSDGIKEWMTPGAYERRGGPYRLFDRGFVARVPIMDTTFLEHADAVFDRTPMTDLWLDARQTEIDSFTASADLRRLRGLLFGCSGRDHIGEIGGFAVARCPHLAGLKRLSFVLQHLTPAAAAAIVGSPHLADLQSLEFEFDPLGEHLPMILGTARLPRLRELRLVNLGLTDADVRGLCESTCIRSLESLTLSGNRAIGDPAAIQLGTTPELAGLHTLELSGTGIGEQGIVALMQSPHLSTIRQLDLSACSRDPNGILNALRKLTWQQLGSLHVSYANTKVVQRISQSPAFQNLVTLRLHLHHATELAIKSLATSPNFAKLERLSLSGQFEKLTAIKLVSSKQLPSLISLELDVGWDGIDAVAEDIAREPGAARLRMLRLGYGRMSDHGANALLTSPYLNNLEQLAIPMQELSESTQQAIRERFGVSIG